MMNRILFFFGFLIACVSCTKLDNPIVGLTNKVEITTTPISSTTVKSDTAIAGGNISSDGGEGIIERGVVWSVTPNPTTSVKERRKAKSGGIGAFSMVIDTLLPFTDYYVRAYAINYYGTVYGQQVPLKTLKGVPRFGTSATISKDAYSMKLSTTITNNGGDPVTSKGFCYSIRTKPNVSLVTSKENGVISVPGSSNFYEVTIPGLLPKTTYYVRPYATSNQGTGYGKEFTVTTEIGPPKLDPVGFFDVEDTSVRLRMAVTSAEGGSIGRRGFVISTSPSYPEPFFYDDASKVTLYEGSQIRTISDGPSKTGIFEVIVPGLKRGTTYYVRAFALNESPINGGVTHTEKIVFTTKGPPSVRNLNVFDPSYYFFRARGTILGDGQSPITERGFYVSANSSVFGDKFFVGGPLGIGDFIADIPGRNAGTTYFVRTFASNRYGESVDNTPMIINTPANTAPVINNAPKNIGFTGKVLSVTGSVDSDGGLPILERGFYYSSSNPSPGPGDSRISQVNGPYSTGDYASTVSTGLVFGNVLYYIRSYARNSRGFNVTPGPVNTFRTPVKTVPTVTNSGFSASARSVTVNGVITSDGFGTISTTGFFLATNEAMTTGLSTTNGSVNTNFFGSFSNLSPNRTYYYQAFANNEVGRSLLPNPSSFTTPCDIPVISFFNYRRNQVLLSIDYNITDLGGALTITRGICLSRTSLNSNPRENGSNVTTFKSTSNTGGIFTYDFTGLTRNTSYSVQAFVTSCYGTVYSGVTTLTTSP